MTASESSSSLSQSPSLPANASLENLRKQAKSLLKRQRQAVEGQLLPPRFTLSAAQHEIARGVGFASWPRLVAHFRDNAPTGRVRREAGRVWIDGVSSLQWGPSPEPTYLGAMEAAFCGSDRPLDLNTMMGDSGLAYRIRWARGVDADTWCGSCPVGEWPDERETLGRATGYAFDWSFPGENADKPIERIVAEVDAGRPILAYGKKHDLGVIYGYEDAGQTVVLSDYWSEGKPVVMPTAEIKGVTAWLTNVVEPLPRGEAVAEGVRLTSRRWAQGTEDTPYAPPMRYYYGPQAYAEWLADLHRADTLTDEQRGNLYFLNGWNYSSLHMTRRDHAAQYIREQSRHLPEAAQAHASDAAGVYERLAQYLGKWDPTDDQFGFVKQKPVTSWTAEVRAAEIGWLEGIAALESEAQERIDRAVNELEASP
ncbi:hypothetical protein [Algisphaera agarilytica]|uniref:Uncharacterized protein n=1 Tax=Algisphaera agarilytica TaxID=1385975 RepID=A0A7X0H7V5_9BACT|nr:hypothetical protein [Algisphaera agarilytica]MBB6429430.1 hypothetical protein [Algisphaera agarilytica]